MNRTVVAKTASYTITPAVDRAGTVFTNRGATGPVTFTLPPVSRGLTGWGLGFRCLADQDLTVRASVPGTLIADNNAAATSIAVSSPNQRISALIEAFCDGSNWIVNGHSSGHTYTIT